MGKMIAYCGIDCSECGLYQAWLNNDQALREKTAAEWTKVHNFIFTPDMMNCTSCKGDGVHIKLCTECEIRNCAIGKKVITCGTCVEFKTCTIINNFLAQDPSSADSLIKNMQNY